LFDEASHRHRRLWQCRPLRGGAARARRPPRGAGRAGAAARPGRGMGPAAAQRTAGAVAAGADAAGAGHWRRGRAAVRRDALLARDGHRVEVFERVPQPGSVGAGFLLQPSALQVLWRMGLLPQVLAHGAVVERLFGDTPCGRAVMEMRYDGLDPRLAGIGLQRGALFSILASAFEGRGGVRAGLAITRLEDDGRVLVDAGGGRHGPYDLVVVADGAASLLRGHAGRVRLDKPYPWGAPWSPL